ncbi:MAG TPA: hypothetical protein DDW52_03720, partial [Planctomycetaceae bacterium]|nr:hypothetical protein [Planctomycetaceae bacterium]
FSLAVLLALIGWALQAASPAAALVLWAVSTAQLAVYYLLPQSRILIIRGWQFVTYPIAWLVGHILFGGVFCLILLPISLVMRLIGYDPLRLRRGARTTNWQDRQKSRSVESYFRQY